EFSRGRVERLGVLDGVELLALVVALEVPGIDLLAQVLGKLRAAAGEEPVEVRLVLGVPGRLLETLTVPCVAPCATAAVAHLLDLTPTFLLFRSLVVAHRNSTRIHRITGLATHSRSLREECRTPLLAGAA